jgi:hypothetical protein
MIMVKLVTWGPLVLVLVLMLLSFQRMTRWEELQQSLQESGAGRSPYAKFAADHWKRWAWRKNLFVDLIPFTAAAAIAAAMF